MRVIVGAIAFLLAPIVYWVSGARADLDSISISYWTDARDIFVGSLITVGFFFSAYNGTGGSKDWEFYLSKASCVFAICVALFPTAGFDNNDIPPAWTRSIANAVHLEPTHIHYGAAILLFVCLTVMMWFFSNRAMRKGRPVRAYIYRVIGILMVVGMISIYTYGKIFDLKNSILLIEIWGLALFGIGWIVAGSYKSQANPPQGGESKGVLLNKA